MTDKNKKIARIVFSICVLIGVMVAIESYRGKILNDYINNNSVLMTSSKMSEKLLLLNLLRDDKPEKAIRYLELTLDMEMDSAENDYKRFFDGNIPEELVPVLSEAKTYRKRFPNQTEHE